MRIKMIAALFLSIFLTVPPLPAQSFAPLGEPYFVGRDRVPAYQAILQNKLFRAAPTYMTAIEMQTTVAALTGYLHPVFIQYADVLGSYDPKTGQRTTDEPSLISVLFMKMIATQVAAMVVEREIFLDIPERIVFDAQDLESSPRDEGLDAFIQALHSRWLMEEAGPQTLRILHDEFRREEQAKGPSAGYAAVVALLLQHGALYYY